jgi:hypothetical protein
MLLFLMFVLAIILSLAVCVYVLLQQQSPRPPKAKGGHNGPPSATRSGGPFPLRRRQPIGIAKPPHDPCNSSNRRFGL